MATPVEKRKGWNNTRNNQPELKRNRRVFRTGIINRQRPLENAEDNVARWGSNNSVIGDRGTPYPRPWPLPDPTEARRPGRRFETEVRKRRATADKESTIAKSDGQGNNEREEKTTTPTKKTCYQIPEAWFLSSPESGSAEGTPTKVISEPRGRHTGTTRQGPSGTAIWIRKPT